MNQTVSKNIGSAVHEQIVLFEFRPSGNYAEEVSAGLHNSLSPGSKTMKRSPELFCSAHLCASPLRGLRKKSLSVIFCQIDPDSQRFMKYPG